MKKAFKRSLALFLCALLTVSLSAPAFAETKGYKISNPYESVAELLGNEENHYKTNLHTHSTASDASIDLCEMIKGYYDRDFDILAMSDHGVIGKEWNKRPTLIPLYLYQYIIGKNVTPLTDEEYEAIKAGTYQTSEGFERSKDRGMQCVPTAIELNMLTISKSHVNGYFCGFGEGDIGFEDGFEYAVKNVEKAGGISVINHPGDWLGSNSDYNIARDPENIRLFGDIFNTYKTCQGMEIFNDADIAHGDRILWDGILQYVIPRGERNVWGFSNSDAHTLDRIDTSFMDFIIPEYSLENVKDTMMNGNFFSVGRLAKAELGHDFRGTGAYPTVTAIDVDDENDIITVTGKDADKIQWIANGSIIAETSVKNADGTITSVIRLGDHSDDITCYIRFQLIGEGGMCCSQPFVLDDGDMARFIPEDTRSDQEKQFEKFIRMVKSLRIFVLFRIIFRKIAN